VPPSLSTGKPAMDYRAVFTAPPKKIPSDNSVDAP